MDIVYRSIADMNEAILRNLNKIPHDIDLVVGIPRSGMLPANLIALYLNKPFTDLDSFIEGRIYSSGYRGQFISQSGNSKVLVVDDSICSGSAQNKAKNKLGGKVKDYNILWGVVYATEDSKNKVDFYCEVTEVNRFFQWNLIHHDEYLQRSFFDIDGVLCPNPPIDDDGPQYKSYIENAPLLFQPSTTIDTLITCRLEKYRSITEKWLSENDIRYNRLIMLNLPNKSARIKWNKHGVFKGNYYKNSNAILFVESSLQEAKDIIKVAKKPVFCIENFSLMNYVENPLRVRLRILYWKLRSKVLNILQRR